MADANWVEIAEVDKLREPGLRVVEVGKRKFALSFQDGQFGLIDNVCNHVGGPLGDGHLDGDYVVCPWHHWKFHRCSGLGEPGFEEDKVPGFTLKEEGGKLFVDLNSGTKRNRLPHEPHPLARKIERGEGPVRVVGISTTAMDEANPRYSTSDALLESGLEHAKSAGLETRYIRLSALNFRNCEGYYSKAARACTWPCSITQMDEKDQLDQVYEAIVHWADVIMVATPIRWGAASALYYKMVERMNCIQNQVTIADRVMLRNKVASFIITGGQDNVQGVAGQMLGFFAEIGCAFPQFPYVAHTRGWDAEDMETNVKLVQHSEKLREGVRALVDRSAEMAQTLLGSNACPVKVNRGGRKAGPL
ncbi:MAG: NAD(P)H-dependent oxidoreductase [Planctomycetes bacterium]|nr:NAD(P)H-dependent oxidoreductase [Planctomycetota bacterium]